MIDFGLRADLAEEAMGLGWEKCGVVSGTGEIRKGVIDGKDYRVCYPGGPEKARKNSADILALDFRDLVFDLVIAKANKYVEFDLNSMIWADSRFRALHNFQKALQIARKQKNKILISTRAEDRYMLRSPRDAESFLRTLGMKQEEISAVGKSGKGLLEAL